MNILFFMTNDRIALFETEKVSKAILKLAIPTVLSSLVMTIYSLADTFFVGMLGNSVENAAVTLSAPVLLAFNAVNNLFGVGGSSMLSRALGRKDYKTAVRSSAFSFYGCVVAGLVFSLLAFIFNDQLLVMVGADSVTMESTRAYLKWTVVFGAVPAILNVVMAYLVRSEGSAMHASIGTMTGCLLNIVLDPIFVLPQFIGMGAEGAGLATFISNCVAVIYFLILLAARRGNTYVSINPRNVIFQKYIVVGVCAVGIPASIQNLLNVTGMTILNNFTSVYGASAVAAIGIAQRLNNVPFSIANGFSQGLMPLVSYNYASGNHKRMKDGVKFSAAVVVSGLILMAAAYFIWSDFFISIFMDDPVIVDHGTRFLHAFCLGIPFMGIDFLAVAVFQAVGKGLYSFIFAIMRKIVLEIPAIIILNRIYPLYGVAYSQFVAEIVMAVLAVITLTHLFRSLGKRTTLSGQDYTD